MIQHITIFLSIAYLFGAGLHLLMRSDIAFRSKVNTFPTRRAWFGFYWVSILVRVCFYGYLLFLAWLNHPAWPAKVAMFFLVPDNVSNWLIITPTLGASIGFGFFADVFLDYTQVFTGALVAKFPWLSWLGTILQSQVPQYDPQVVNLPQAKYGK